MIQLTNRGVKRGNQAELNRFPELRRHSGESGRPRKPEFSGRVSERREMQRQRTPGICRGSPSTVQLRTDKNMHVRTLPEARDNQSKGLEKTAPSAYRGPTTGLFPQPD